MNHSKESNPEDTSEKLEVLEEASEETGKEELKEEEEPTETITHSVTIPTETPVTTSGEEEIEVEKEEVPEEKEEPEEWICDICETVYSSDSTYEISGYHEKICGQCYDRGLMWCIREAWKWRAQVRIDVLRKPRDE